MNLQACNIWDGRRLLTHRLSIIIFLLLELLAAFRHSLVNGQH